MGNSRHAAATNGLEAQLAEYDSRLNVLREQLKSSVDLKLRGSALAGLGGVGALAQAGGADTIPAVKADDKETENKNNMGPNSDKKKNNIVDRLVTATGQGCKEVLEGSLLASGVGKTKSGSFWKTRPFKQEQVKSSCTLKLKHKTSENVTIRVTFAPGKSVPAALVFEHAPKATAEFKRVGMVALKKKSVTQTKHVFHLGNGARVNRFLRVSCVGLIGDTKNKLHAVSYLLVSGDEAPDTAISEQADASESALSESLVSEGVYKEDGAEFRVSMECGNLEGTLAEGGAGRKALGVKNVKDVQSADELTNTKTIKKTPRTSQSSASVWERLSNYKPADKGSLPQPTMRVPSAPAASAAPAAPPASVASVKTRTPQPQKPAALRSSLLDKQRAVFVDGVLSSFGVGGLEAAEMVKNVVFGNSSLISSLTQEQIDDLVECLPTIEERKLFRSLDRLAGTGVHEAEYFMAELAAIDNLAAKVETKWFLADFDARVAVVQDASNLISTACHEIRGCSKLHLAIRIILSECSETLQGAKLLDITLLEELKRVTYNSQGSLLHFVAAKLSEAAGSMKVPNLARDLPSCAPASQVALSDVKGEMELLMDGLDEASLAWRADEPAAATVERRLDAAQSKLSSTEAIVTETEADFIECAINSGLDPESVKDSEELFRALLDFSDDLNNAHLENKCIGFLTKSKTQVKTKTMETIERELVQQKPKQQLRVNEQQSSTSLVGRDSIELMPSPGMASVATDSTTASIGGTTDPSASTPSFGAPLAPNAATSSVAEVAAVATTSAVVPSLAPTLAPSPSPMASRVSVEQLMQSAQKSTSVATAPCEAAPDNNQSEWSEVGEELSTPVRNLLRSSRALIESFDLRKVNSVSPIKYVREDRDRNELNNGMDDVKQQSPAVEPVPNLDDAFGADDHLCEMSSPRMDMRDAAAERVEKAPETKVEKAESSAVEEIQPDDDAVEDSAVETGCRCSQPMQSVPLATTTSATPAPEAIVTSIDLGLAAKLLSNADKVKASRGSGSSALRSAHRLSTPQSLRMSKVPVLGSRRRSSRSSMHKAGSSGVPRMSGVSGHVHRTPGELVSKSRGRTLEQEFDSPNLTPEQTKAVQALGEVIRQSLPAFSSIEADKQSGLHLDTQNLDLDKILSTIILNAGNTPTGPLARGVRGGNEALFDGEGAEELRRNGQLQGRHGRSNRKALLEPIVPAPLGMGVSVSNTVSKGISPQTLARSLQSSMRASTSVPTYSRSAMPGNTSGLANANQRSVKGSFHIPKLTEGVSRAEDLDNANAVAALTQSNLRASKVSRDTSTSKSYSKIISKDYSKAPAWKEDTVARSDERVNAKPVFMAGPSTAAVVPSAGAIASSTSGATAPMAQHMASIDGVPNLRPEMIPEEELEAVPTPYHGFDMHDEDDTCGLSPLGLPDYEDDSMAKDRMDHLWGMKWD